MWVVAHSNGGHHHPNYGGVETPQILSTDIDSTNAISIELKATRTTLVQPAFWFMLFVAFRASLACASLVLQDYFHAYKFGFVGKQLSKLSKRPTM